MTQCERAVDLEGFGTICGAPLNRIKVCPFAVSDCYPGQIIFVIAPTYEWFVNWCLVDCVPPENPNDRKYIVLSNREDAGRLVRGRHHREGDKVLWLGSPEWSGLLEVIQGALIPCGFTECVDQFGRKFPL